MASDPSKPSEEKEKEKERRTQPPPPPADDSETESVRQRLQGIIPDLVKRTFYAGLGAVFTTEEGIKKIASEFSLPKDVATYLIQSAQGTKDELFRVVANELRQWLERLNLGEELVKILTSLSFEIKTEIRLIPNDAGAMVKPDIKRKVTIKRVRDDGTDEEVESKD
jgi:hypothetical protein